MAGPDSGAPSQRIEELELRVGVHPGWPPASTGQFSQQLLEAAALSEAASRGDLGYRQMAFVGTGIGLPLISESSSAEMIGRPKEPHEIFTAAVEQV
jgi:hypothetical protein